jgi:hypothetical protein
MLPSVLQLALVLFYLDSIGYIVLGDVAVAAYVVVIKDELVIHDVDVGAVGHILMLLIAVVDIVDVSIAIGDAVLRVAVGSDAVISSSLYCCGDDIVVSGVDVADAAA